MGRKKTKVVQRKHWLLFAGGSLAAFAFVFWQTSSSATIPGSRAPLQLTLSAPPEAVKNVPANVVSKDAAAVTPVKKTKNARASKPTLVKAKAPAPKDTPRVIARADAPAAAKTADRTEGPVAPSTAVAPKSSAMSYEAKARASLEKRDYDEARDHIESALARGGKATFMIVHDHNRGNFEADDPDAVCVGQLTIHADEVRFEPRHEGDRFAAKWPEVREVGSNRFFGSGRGGFHVSINSGGKYKNFNLAPESKEKAEAKLILDLLNSYTRAADRSK
jgi:hypothetical protein